MNDQRLDALIRTALDHEAERVAGLQPTFAAAIDRLSRRVAAGSSGGSAGVTGMALPGLQRPMARVLWLALLLSVVAAAAIVGAQLLREDRVTTVEASASPAATPRPVVEGRPFGFGAPCAVGLDPDALLEVGSTMGTTTYSTTYWRSGRITGLVIGGGMGPPDPERRREHLVAGTHLTEGTLSPSGLELVELRIADDLDLAPGCYAQRTRESDGTLRFHTAAGAVDLNWRQSAGDWSSVRLMPVDETETLRFLAAELADPGSWLPESAFSVQLAPSGPFVQSWIVHIVLDPSDYSPDAVLHLGSGVPVSSTDGRYAGVVLPDRGDLVTFGRAMSLRDVSRPRNAQRCGVISGDDALRLARSLDKVAIDVPDEADLYTPDMAVAIHVELVPARQTYDCAAYEADLRRLDDPPAQPGPGVAGDLAEIDPCDMVPGSLRRRVETGYSWPDPALGVALRRCVLVNEAPMGVTRERETLWLYPRTITLDEAAAAVHSMFGAGVTEMSVDDKPAWLNHCLSGGSCAGAIAAWAEGRLLVLEIIDTTLTAAARTDRARADMAAILATLE